MAHQSFITQWAAHTHTLSLLLHINSLAVVSVWGMQELISTCLQVWFRCYFFCFDKGNLRIRCDLALSFTAGWQVYLSRTGLSLPIKWHVNPGRVENSYFGGLGLDINPVWKSFHLLPSYPSNIQIHSDTCFQKNAQPARTHALSHSLPSTLKILRLDRREKANNYSSFIGIHMILL